MKAALTTLAGERRQAMLSISFLSRDRMRALNRRWKGNDRPTDVLAFPLEGPGGSLAGDIYICPWVAVRSAREAGVPLPQELARLVIHGALHVVGHDHPDGPGRTTSPMWRRQERYLRKLR
jgi:probable rRNA maturation factor